jgi:hypothetical protein
MLLRPEKAKDSFSFNGPAIVRRKPRQTGAPRASEHMAYLSKDKTYTGDPKRGFNMKTKSLKSNMKHTMAITAIAVLSSTCTGAAFAGILGYSSGDGKWVRNSIKSRENIRAVFWQTGWNACRSIYPQTRSISVYNMYVYSRNDKDGRWIIVDWTCNSSTKAPPDRGPASLP